MKKLIAVILAVLLLGSTIACAETGPVLDLKDPVLEFSSGEESGSLDLAGLTLRFGVLGEGDDACLVLNILGDGEPLFAAAAQLDEGRVLVAADGLSHSYAVPMTGAQFVGSSDEDGSAMAALGSDLMEKLMAEAEIGMEGERITFRLPYTAVNKLLREMLPMLDKVPNLDEIVEQLDEMEAQGQGFEVSGSLSMTDGFDAELDLTPVEGGEAAEKPAVRMLVNFEPDEEGGDFYLTVLTPDEGDDPVFMLVGYYRSYEAGLSLHVEVYADTAAVAGDSPSAVFDVIMDEEFVMQLLLPGTFRFGASFTPASSELALEAETEDFEGRLTMTAETGEGELKVCAFPASVIDIEGGLSEEQSSELSSELQVAIAPVLGFLMPALMNAGVLG